MKKLCTCFFVLLAGFVSRAQQEPFANTLLWRISGNGLTKPSYLYGTMHLTDKRIFHFTDSLYRALERVEGLATELDMNRFGMEIVNEFLKESEEKKSKEPTKLKDAVSAEIWNKYKEPLSKKLGINADKITLDDLEEISSDLQSEILRKGDMPTFLDAHLFGLARKMGKWVGGIEDFADQMEHILESTEEKIQTALYEKDYYTDGLEQMIKIYLNQQLDSIDKWLYRSEDGQKDLIMIKRNLKMARRMDSLSAIRSMMFAVGAAHLPGDSGVINLLRSRGFTVSPVISNKKIHPDKYVVKSSGVVPWTQVSVPDSVYSLQMPGHAESMAALQDISGLNMKMYLDISALKMYMTLSAELAESRSNLGKDSIYKMIALKYNDAGASYKEKNIVVNGSEGKEFSFTTEDGEIRIQLFLPMMRYIILNGMFAYTDKALKDKESDRFFQSFVFHRLPEKKPVVAEKNWVNKEYSAQAYKLSWPSQPREKKDVTSEEGKIIFDNSYIDIRSQVYYGIRVSDVKEGLHNTIKDSSAFFGLNEYFRGLYTDCEMLDSSYFKFEGYPAYELKFKAVAEGQAIEGWVLTVNRGSRNYYLYAAYEPNAVNRKNTEQFIRSFQLTPYPHKEWKTQTDPSGSFSTTAPVAIKYNTLDETSLTLAKRYIIYDSLSCSSIMIDVLRVPDWYWGKTDTAFLRMMSKNYITYSDSNIEYKVTTGTKSSTVDFLVKEEGAELLKKVRLILNGEDYYEIAGHVSRRDLDENFKYIFENFKILNEKDQRDQSKQGVIHLSAALKSAGKEEVERINNWWNWIDFKNEDLPVLQQMALKTYSDFDTSYFSLYYSNLNGKIFAEIEELDSTKSMVAFLKENYPLIGKNDEYLKVFAISHLSNIKTAESYDVLKELLNKYSLDVPAARYFTFAIYDSLELTAKLYPDLLRFSGNEALWEYITGVSTWLLDSNLITEKMIKDHYQGFIASGKRMLQKSQEEIDNGAVDYNDLIRILGIINNAESNAILNKVFKFDSRSLRYHAMIALLKNNHPVDSKTIYTMATTDEFRLPLYEELKKMKKLSLFPITYLNQRELAQSKMYQVANDEGDEPPIHINYVTQRTITVNGKQEKYYLYKIMFNEDSYLGIAGPFSSNYKEVNSSHSKSGLYWEESFDEDRVEEMFKEFLKSFED